MAPLTELFGFPPSGTISPSVRLLETDYSYYNAGTSFSKSALVGFASKGPINEPTQVFNHEELYRKFGYPDPTADHGSYLIYAAIEFLKYGTEAWILRVGTTDEDDWDNFAKTAYTEINSSGTSAVIKSLGTYTDGSALPTQVLIEEDINDKFRFSVNGALYNRVIQIPAGTYNLVPGTVASDTDLVDQFNLLFVDDDGIEAYTDDSKIAFRTTKIFGSSASIELISVEDAIYEAIGIGKDMTIAEVICSNTEWPEGSSNIGFYFGDYEGTGPTLEVRVSGTADAAIDNVTQTIPFEDLTHATDALTVNTGGFQGPQVTAATVVEYINWWVDNVPSGYTIPGGFRAAITPNGQQVSLYTAKRYIDAGGNAETSQGLTDNALNPNTGLADVNYDGINTIRGADALVQVRFQSKQVDTILGFSNNASTGTYGATVGAPSSAAFIAGGIDATTSKTIDEIGYTLGYNYTASEQPLLLTIWAESPGLSGNNTQVAVAVDDEGLISLTIYNNGIYVESHSQLNLDSTTTNNPYYIEQWINGFSDYLFIEHEATVSGLPIVGTYTLGQTAGTAGSDGYPYNIDGLPDSTAIDALVVGSTQLGTGLNALAEPEKIDIDLVAVPAINSTSVMNALIELCGITRRDCMAIMDSPASLSSLDVKKWHNGAHPLNTQRLDSSYAALYWPWVKIRDGQNAVDVWVPPTGSILGVYANAERISNAWAAPAGLRRGTIPTILEVETYAYLTERDSLYGNRNAVNVIVPFPVEGPTVWGQKTLQRNTTALDRVNVRRLMLYLEKNMKIRTRFLIFEPHDEQLRSEFVRVATNLLNEIQRGRGLADFIVKCDEELNTSEVIDRNELRAKIGVQPTKTAEFIFIEFTLHKTGTFEESSV